MKMIVGIFLGLLFLVSSFLLWASYPWSINEKAVNPEVVHLEPEGMVDWEEFPTVIKFMTWNIGYLYGLGSEGPGYEYKDKTFYEDKLEKFVQEVIDANVDVVALQEVDFDSSRSHFINEAQYLAKKANYPYIAEIISWEANYIPFPYWPFSNHFGKVRSGGAILSRYPILEHEAILLSKPQSHPWWYNMFYLHRYFQKVTLEVGDKKFKVINLHLEAFDKIDRESQIEKLKGIIPRDKIDFVLGDFNMIPASATKRSKFFNNDNYEDDSSYEKMMESNLQEVIPDEIYAQDENLYMTFPSNKPDRRLDYIFYNGEYKMMKAEVLPSALSDHLPLKATFQISSPKINLYPQ